MEELIIVCNSSFGLDIHFIVDQINEERIKNGLEAAYLIKGYLLPNSVDGLQIDNSTLILGTIEEWIPGEGEVYAMGITEPSIKENYVAVLKTKGARFVTLCAPWVLVPPEVTYGEGCIIAAHSIKKNAVIKNYVTLFYAMLANAEIGDFTSIMAFSNVTNASICKGCYLGPNSAVMMNLELCDDVSVMPNSVIVRNVKTPGVLMGIPARKLKSEGADK